VDLTMRGGGARSELHDGGDAVEIVESLDERLREAAQLQRLVIFAPGDAACVSAVLVRVPPGHSFPLHTHPAAEDCFFVLSGAGQALEPGRSMSIRAPAGVWVPAGHPHGLAAGPAGMLEVGFQAPPDPTAVPFHPGEDAPAPALLTRALPSESEPGRTPAGWSPVFPDRDRWQHLDPYYSMVRSPEPVVAEARESELVVVVMRGAVELVDPRRRRIDAAGMLRLRRGVTVELHAAESPTLLVGIRARRTQ
jgi:quercetin dioxygenase-like cupin family protein